MISEDGPKVIYEPESNYKWARHWQLVEDPPNHNGPVWGYCPDLGNDEEGYGLIIVARCLHKPLFEPYEWADEYGRKVRITHWAPMTYPELPFPTTKEPPCRNSQPSSQKTTQPQIL